MQIENINIYDLLTLVSVPSLFDLGQVILIFRILAFKDMVSLSNI